MSLFSDFLRLKCATSDSDFNAISLSSNRLDFLARTSDGSPVFLLHDAGDATYIPGLRLQNLSAEFHVTCRVKTETGPIENQFAMISCDESAPDLFELFINCFAATAERLGPNAETAEIKRQLEGMLDLFRAMGQPSGRAVSGLWAELFILAKSSNVAAALHWWRSTNFDRFDFSFPGGCLEVKATTNVIRAHEFALEQLHPPVNSKGMIASVLLQYLESGIGIMDLAKEIESSLIRKPSLRQKLWTNIVAALGNDFSSKIDTRFDRSYAERNLRLFAMSAVPAPAEPSDRRVFNLRFQSDLTSISTSISFSAVDTLLTSA